MKKENQDKNKKLNKNLKEKNHRKPKSQNKNQDLKPKEIQKNIIDSNTEKSKNEEPIKGVVKRKIQVKNEFKNRISLLDECSPESSINTSVFKGFRNLGKIIGIFLTITIPIVKNLENLFILYID